MSQVLPPPYIQDDLLPEGDPDNDILYGLDGLAQMVEQGITPCDEQHRVADGEGEGWCDPITTFITIIIITINITIITIIIVITIAITS